MKDARITPEIIEALSKLDASGIDSMFSRLIKPNIKPDDEYDDSDWNDGEDSWFSLYLIKENITVSCLDESYNSIYPIKEHMMSLLTYGGIYKTSRHGTYEYHFGISNIPGDAIDVSLSPISYYDYHENGMKNFVPSEHDDKNLYNTVEREWYRRSK